MIGAAAANISGMSRVDIVVARVWVTFDQRYRRENLAALAVAALRNVYFVPSPLYRMFPLGIEPFDRCDVHTGDASSGRYAGSHWRSVY